MNRKRVFVSGEYFSNCFIEAMKAKLRNRRNVKVYFCKPRITENGHFQMLHFMRTDGKADYDFSDNGDRGLPWYKCLWFKGRIRKFEKGFAKSYAAYRNGK